MHATRAGSSHVRINSAFNVLALGFCYLGRDVAILCKLVESATVDLCQASFATVVAARARAICIIPSLHMLAALFTQQ